MTGIIENKATERRTEIGATLGRAALSGIIVLLGLGLATPLNCLFARQEIGESFNPLDDSWSLELPARWLRGEYAGKDFVFTYGPLYQLVHTPVLSGGSSKLASLLRFSTAYVSPQETWTTCLGLWALL